jgi:hypothetical protein
MTSFLSREPYGLALYFKCINTGTSDSDAIIPLYALVDANGNSYVTGQIAVQTSQTGMLNVIPQLRYNSGGVTLSDGQTVMPQCDIKGNEKVNPGIYNGAPAQTAVSVTTTTAQILAANANVTYRLFQNQDATNPVYLLFANSGSATADNNCLKIPAGGVHIQENSFVSNTAVQAISTGGTVLLHIMEGS